MNPDLLIRIIRLKSKFDLFFCVVLAEICFVVPYQECTVARNILTLWEVFSSSWGLWKKQRYSYCYSYVSIYMYVTCYLFEQFVSGIEILNSPCQRCWDFSLYKLEIKSVCNGRLLIMLVITVITIHCEKLRKRTFLKYARVTSKTAWPILKMACNANHWRVKKLYDMAKLGQAKQSNSFQWCWTRKIYSRRRGEMGI